MSTVSGHHGSSAHAHVRMVARSASIPVARRFAVETLAAWSHDQIADEVGLCVTELSTNATLHGRSSYFDLELSKTVDAVRVSVSDSLDPSGRSADAPAAPEPWGTTGRGLVLVATVARAWGVDQTRAGKQIWAELPLVRPPGAEPVPSAPTVRLLDGGPGEDAAPKQGRLLRLPGCPVRLCLAHDDNLADYIRELWLIASDDEGEPPRRLAELLADLRERHAAGWEPGRLLAQEALRRGEEVADIEVVATEDISEDVRALQSLLWRADALAEAGLLITLPAPSPVQRAREWMAEQFLRQMAGEEPTAYADWEGQS